MKTFADKKIIERIVTAKQWDRETTDKLNKCNKNYGYVMPLYHGFDWKPTKKALIEKYT